MHELAPVPHRRSLAIDWAAMNDASTSFAAHEDIGAMLLKGGRHRDFAAFVARELRVSPPESSRVHLQGDVTWLWQGPREWLLLSNSISGESLAARVGAKLGGLTAAALDVSDRIIILEITGPGARAVISKGTSLDLLQLMPRSCCRTRFAGLHATLFRLDDSETYGLIVDRTASVHLNTWLRKGYLSGG